MTHCTSRMADPFLGLHHTKRGASTSPKAKPYLADKPDNGSPLSTANSFSGNI